MVFLILIAKIIDSLYLYSSTPLPSHFHVPSRAPSHPSPAHRPSMRCPPCHSHPCQHRPPTHPAIWALCPCRVSTPPLHSAPHVLPAPSSVHALSAIDC